MTDSAAVARCVANNIAWYRAVLSPHGAGDAIDDGVWSSRDDLPPYYSNAMTVAPGPVDRQVAAIAELVSTLGRPFSVKDSFGRLDLAALGFSVHLEAEWIWRDGDVEPAREAGTDAEWRPVTASDELEAWEAAWREQGSPADRRVFLPALLADPSVRMFAAHRGGRIVAGFATNRSDDVVGLSNTFAEAGLDDASVVAAIVRIAEMAPGRPIVGFERGAALEQVRSLGFRSVGPLRVWTFEEP